MHIAEWDITFELCAKSETLWFLPPLDISLASSETVELYLHFVSASDNTSLLPERLGCGCGAFPENEYPVVVPNAHVLLEAYLRIHARDVGTGIGSFAMASICYMKEYVEGDGYLDSAILPEPLKALYAELKEGETSMRKWTEALMEALCREDEPFKTPEHVHEGECPLCYVYIEDDEELYANETSMSWFCRRRDHRDIENTTAHRLCERSPLLWPFMHAL